MIANLSFSPPLFLSCPLFLFFFLPRPCSREFLPAVFTMQLSFRPRHDRSTRTCATYPAEAGKEPSAWVLIFSQGRHTAPWLLKYLLSSHAFVRIGSLGIHLLAPIQVFCCQCLFSASMYCFSEGLPSCKGPCVHHTETHIAHPISLALALELCSCCTGALTSRLDPKYVACVLDLCSRFLGSWSHLYVCCIRA